MMRIVALVCSVFAAALPAQVTLHDPAGKELVAVDVEIEKLGGGMQFVEGPVWLADEGALVFSDIPRGKLLRWTAKDGVVEWRDSEQSNGNTLDLKGRLISCQHAGRNIVRHEEDGKVTVLASSYDGKSLNSPNDAAVRSDGSIWFTDPTYGLRGRKQEQNGNFVYRLDPGTGDIAIVQRDFDMPNGICFSPNQQTLYIADSGSKQRVGAFGVLPGGTLGEPLFWLDGGADGIRCDERGNLYTTARDGVRIYSPTGTHLATIKLPEVPANCAFGGDDLRDLFVTARTSLYRVRLLVGAPPVFDPDQWMPPANIGLGGLIRGAGGRYGGRAGRRSVGPYATAIGAGLEWLKNHQDEDGRWDCDGFMKHDTEGEACDGAGEAAYDVGVTGLALLAFLGDGSTMRVGPYKQAVKSGVKWLRDQQQDDGLFGARVSHDFIYSHAIASYAMCEAYGVSAFRLLRPNAQRSIDYLEAHRNPYKVWRYQARDGDNDTSITGWSLMAYATGELFGLTINKKALQLCETWLDEVSDPSGRHGYAKRGERSSRMPGDHATRFPVDKGESLTAVGLFCRFFLGQNPKEKPVMTAAAYLIAGQPPVWNEKDGSIDLYYWYWATNAMFQMGGEFWADWRSSLTEAVIPHQHDGRDNQNLAGSWDPVGVWGKIGGRVYSTAMLTLTLETPYRYTRFTR